MRKQVRSTETPDTEQVTGSRPRSPPAPIRQPAQPAIDDVTTDVTDQTTPSPRLMCVWRKYPPGREQDDPHERVSGQHARQAQTDAGQAGSPRLRPSSPANTGPPRTPPRVAAAPRRAWPPGSARTPLCTRNAGPARNTARTRAPAPGTRRRPHAPRPTGASAATPSARTTAPTCTASSCAASRPRLTSSITCPHRPIPGCAMSPLSWPAIPPTPAPWPNSGERPEPASAPSAGCSGVTPG
jgi:hypothetical protein